MAAMVASLLAEVPVIAIYLQSPPLKSLTCVYRLVIFPEPLKLQEKLGIPITSLCGVCRPTDLKDTAQHDGQERGGRPEDPEVPISRLPTIILPRSCPAITDQRRL